MQINKDLLHMCEYGTYDTDKFLDSKIGFSRTRVQNRHCYVEECYSKIFPRIEHSAKQILEIGVDFGGSLLLWRDYFTNAQITGIDINPCHAVENQDRIHMIVNDAYSKPFADSLQDNYFDLIIDDGPHTLESMINFIKLYHSKLSETGIMVIEDISRKQWFDILWNEIPEDLRKYTKMFDYTLKYHRYDDMFIVIDKGVLVNG